jgi:hypothetical protein
MSFQYLDDDMVLDQDFSPADYFTLQQKQKEWAITGDFVARGPQSGRYSWLNGIFAFYKKNKMDAPVTFFETGIEKLITTNRNNANPYYPIAWDESNFTLGSSFTMPSGGLSVYHESAMKFGDFTATILIRLLLHCLCTVAMLSILMNMAQLVTTTLSYYLNSRSLIPCLSTMATSSLR